MSFGSNVAVLSAENKFRDLVATRIALDAAELVVDDGFTREGAIEKATERLREEIKNVEFDGEDSFTPPSRSLPQPVTPQIAAVAAELKDQADVAASSF